MILILGKHDVIMEHVKETMHLSESDVFCCPAITTHHTEFCKHIDEIKSVNPPVITTQNIEMLDVLLESELEFKVVRTRRFDDEIRTAEMSKEEVLGNRNAWNFDPRD